MDDPLAHLLDGLDVSHDRRYVAERELGRGSMGVVYAGRDVVLDRPVAIKVMAASAAADAERRRCFEREARAAGRLSHRHVVTVHDFGYDVHGAPYVVMELLRGRDLRQLLAERTALPLDRRLAIVLQVLAGLAHAHACGVVHRDVKPANVFITDEGVVKLLDFGIARLGPTSAAGSSDAVMGTADYMSPEQVLGDALDGRSDLFACGALLFELLAGRPPFHAESFVTIAYRVVHEEPAYAALPPAARALVPVVRKALAKERGARYSTAADFATDLALATGVGVAPETIHPAPAWTIPLPRLSRPAAGAPAVRPTQPWEEGAVRPPDHSPMRPRWPLRPAADEDDAAPEPGRHALRMPRAWVMGTAAAGAVVAVAMVAAGGGRPSPGPEVAPAAHVMDAAAAPLTAPSLAALPPAVDTEPAFQAPAPAASEFPLPAASPPAAPTTSRMAAADRGFWSVASASVPPQAAPPVAAQAPALPTPAPQPEVAPQPPVVRGRWTGYVTDDLCRERGAASDHGQCLETCLRRGRQPLISIDGELYKLVGLDRIRGLHDRRVVVEGQLDLRRRALVVTAGWPAQ